MSSSRLSQAVSSSTVKTAADRTTAPGLGGEATRAQLGVAREGQLSETRAVTDWERFNERLTEELSAAEGQVERLISRLEEVEQHDVGQDPGGRGGREAGCDPSLSSR